MYARFFMAMYISCDGQEEVAEPCGEVVCTYHQLYIYFRIYYLHKCCIHISTYAYAAIDSLIIPMLQSVRSPPLAACYCLLPCLRPQGHVRWYKLL